MGVAPEHRPEDERSESSSTASPALDDDRLTSSRRGQLHTAGAAPAHSLRMFVPGIPKSQGSMKALSIGGRARVMHANSPELNAWRSVVSLAAYELWGDHPLLDEAVVVVMDFWLPKPKSLPKRRIHPITGVDVDKLSRGVLDALTGVVIRDDVLVVRLVADKHYAIDRPTGADIYVHPVEV
jgi:crossover junction endodeoxyribonuclease RusA